MRIAIIASGSRGDIEPYIALSKGAIHESPRIVRAIREFVAHSRMETAWQLQEPRCFTGHTPQLTLSRRPIQHDIKEKTANV